MQSALPLNGGGRGSNTLAKLALNFPRYEGAGGEDRRGEFLLRGDDARKRPRFR